MCQTRKWWGWDWIPIHLAPEPVPFHLCAVLQILSALFITQHGHCVFFPGNSLPLGGTYKQTRFPQNNTSAMGAPSITL